MNSKEDFAKKLNIIRSSDDVVTSRQAAEEAKFKRTAYLILSGVSLLLTIMNILNGFYSMMWMTLLLCFGFVIGILLNKLRRGEVFSEFFISLMLMVIFSNFFIGGRNEGFAALWLLLVPIASMLLLRPNVALILSGYFLLLLIFCMYTPWRAHVESFYTETFMNRFPVLYLVNFVLAVYLAFNLRYSQKLIFLRTYTDTLTGLKNRTFYDSVREDYYGTVDGFTIISLDVNGLKKVNDQFGHLAGDRLLHGAAECISKAFPQSLLNARVGGDEFVVLADSEHTDVSECLNNLARYTEEWSSSNEFRLDISYGVSFKSEAGQHDYESLYSLADRRMYESKENYYRKLS